MDKSNFNGPIVLAILDGVGLAPDAPGNAVAAARTPFLSRITRNYPCFALDASGESVGLSKNQMGNSEVGHRTIGSGQVLKQGIAAINAAFENDQVSTSKTWQDLIKFLKPTPENLWYNEKTLHFAGIFSDGGVHSDLNHLKKLIEKAYDDGVKKIRLHCIFDGRDVAPNSAEKYIEEIETFFRRFPNSDFKIASGVGRMVGVSDRYESDWPMVERGFNLIVHGEIDEKQSQDQNQSQPKNRKFHSATEALKSLRPENPNDQYLPPFLIVDQNETPIGQVNPGDAFIFYDFRADRAIEFSEAMTAENFPHFDRKTFNPEKIFYAGLTEYDLDRHIPNRVLIPPIQIQDTLSEFLSKNQKSQLAISETVKFGHITYYFNGNRQNPNPNENFIEIQSDARPLGERPWMKSAEITDAAIENLQNYDFIRLNYPNGDMVGHLADFHATVLAIESLDLELARLAKAVDGQNGILLITADHGNAEELFDQNDNPKTSHTTNPVPFIIYGNAPVIASLNRAQIRAESPENPSLANLAATIAELFGLQGRPASWQKSLIELH